MKNIYLIGFMGAGKSKIGRLLAKKLKRQFIDTDELIEIKAKCSIAAIFSKDGESHFRKLEKEIVKEISERNGLIIALGGGAPLYEENWNVIARSGITFYLRHDPDTLFSRLLYARTPRPLLEGHKVTDKLGKIKNLLSEREPYYVKADFIIECNNYSPYKLANMIKNKVKNEENYS